MGETGGNMGHDFKGGVGEGGDLWATPATVWDLHGGAATTWGGDLLLGAAVGVGTEKGIKGPPYTPGRPPREVPYRIGVIPNTIRKPVWARNESRF